MPISKESKAILKAKITEINAKIADVNADIDKTQSAKTPYDQKLVTLRAQKDELIAEKAEIQGDIA